MVRIVTFFAFFGFGYFDTLQLNDGTLFTEFDPKCDRFENGLRTTNNAAKPLGPSSALGCADQFKAGMRKFASGVTLITSARATEQAGLVATAVSSVSTTPPTLLIWWHAEQCLVKS